jgi:hypothetical protein
VKELTYADKRSGQKYSGDGCKSEHRDAVTLCVDCDSLGGEVVHQIDSDRRPLFVRFYPALPEKTQILETSKAFVR